MNSELKPCPFCGGEPHIVEDLSVYWVRCDSLTCGACPKTIPYNTRESAINAWNTRAERTCNAEQIPYMPGCYEGYWCSVCHCIEFESDEPNYCPNCGAKVVK